MTYRVFLSHSSEDRDLVEAVKRQVSALGVDVYLAEQDPQAGSPLAAKIERQIDDSDAIVVLLTKSGYASAFVNQEIGYARKARKLVIPLVAEGVATAPLGLLSGSEYITLRSEAPLESYEQLTARLAKLARAKDFAEWESVQRQRELVLAALVIGALIVLSSGTG